MISLQENNINKLKELCMLLDIFLDKILPKNVKRKPVQKDIAKQQIHSIRIHTDRQTQQCLNCYPSKLSKIKISHWSYYLNSRTSKCDRSTKPGAPICSLLYPCEYSVKQIIYCKKWNKPLFMSVTEKTSTEKERILMEMSTQNSSSFKSCVT